MNALEQIHDHRSIRTFTDEPVSDEVINTIIEAGSRASSSGNMQIVSVIVTREEEKKKKLWEFHHKQDMILESPVILTFCADWHRMIRWCELRDAKQGYDNFLNFMVAAGDTFVSSQNAALAAEHLGLGICYMGTTLWCAQELGELFKLPQYVIPVTTLVMGYPAEQPDKRYRFPISSIKHEEEYHSYTDEDIDRIYSEKESEGWERYMSIPRLKNMITEADVHNLAQVYTDLKYTLTENVKFSQSYLSYMKEQGFMNNDRNT